MTKLEKLAEQIMIECEKDNEPVTKEEALEMAKMELGEKEIKHYEKSDKPRKKTERVRKVDEDKKHLINCIKVLLEGITAEIEPLKNETDLHFTYKDNSYSIKLIKHRPKK